MKDILRRSFRGRAATDTGKVRGYNDDYYAALEGKESALGVDALLVVADEMGGHAAGEAASRMTVEGIFSLGDQCPSYNAHVYDLGNHPSDMDHLLGRVSEL